MNEEKLGEAIHLEAGRHNLPECLLHAIALVESGGDIYAYRVEPPYHYLWDVRAHKPFRGLTTAERDNESAPSDFSYWPGISSHDTEWWGQQASWGPMQVMGSVAREYGFNDRFPGLCSAATGVGIGTLYLEKLKNRFYGQYGWRGVAAAYNAGSPRLQGDGTFINQDYVDRVAAAGGFMGIATL